MGTELSQDSIINVFHNSIRKGITNALENGCEASAIILMLAAIDTMSYLSMPADQEDVHRSDFLRWADRYIRFPGTEVVTGADLYGARCAMLHNFGAHSRMSRNGECRVILWMDHAIPPVIYKPELQPNYLFVSIVAFRSALFEGIDRFLIDTYKNPGSKAAQLLDHRLPTLVHAMRRDEIMSGPRERNQQKLTDCV